VKVKCLQLIIVSFPPIPWNYTLLPLYFCINTCLSNQAHLFVIISSHCQTYFDFMSTWWNHSGLVLSAFQNPNTTQRPAYWFPLHNLIWANDRIMPTSVSLLSRAASESGGVVTNVLDFILSPLCKWDLRSSGMLGSENLWLFTEVSRPPICPIFKGQADRAGNCLVTDVSGQSIGPFFKSQASKKRTA
jgi:hypothetical protein